MSGSANRFSVRPDWLARHKEGALDRLQPIIDAHHHLYLRPDISYLLPDYLEDLNTGHRVLGSVFVQARAMLRSDGPLELRAIGETEFVNGTAAMAASGRYGDQRVCAAIVGFADLLEGDAVRPVLERQIAAAGGLTTEGGRLAGIHQTLCWDPDPGLLNAAYPTSAEMTRSAAFRAGFAHLAPLGLRFDAWAFFPQLPAVAELARAFPETPIVVNHCGGVVRVADYAGRSDIYPSWASGIDALAQCPNVMIKLSGLGMRLGGFGFDDGREPPSSIALAEAWKPWVDHCLDRFGPDRCMWGSNFPVDKGSYGFPVGLNAFKRLLNGAGPDEKDAFFWRSASRFYGLRAGAIRIKEQGDDATTPKPAAAPAIARDRT